MSTNAETRFKLSTTFQSQVRRVAIALKVKIPIKKYPFCHVECITTYITLYVTKSLPRRKCAMSMLY